MNNEPTKEPDLDLASFDVCDEHQTVCLMGDMCPKCQAEGESK